MDEVMPFWEVTPEGFRSVIDTNLTGYFLVARAVVPRFLAQKRGRIINITMNHETMRRRGFTPYGPSRAGAEALSLIMAEDLAPYQIAVHLLLPGGATDTGMIPEAARTRDGLTVLPADIMARPICYLCSSGADGLSPARIVAKDFDEWLSQRRKSE
jgi:gluconate 5-dehydrogenase